MPLFRILQNPFGDFLYAIGFLVEYTLVRLVRGLRILGRWLRRVLGNLLLLALRPPIRALLDLRTRCTRRGGFSSAILCPWRRPWDWWFWSGAGFPSPSCCG